MRSTVLKYSIVATLLVHCLSDLPGQAASDTAQAVVLEDVLIVDRAEQRLYRPFNATVDSLGKTFLPHATLAGALESLSSIYIKTYNPGGLSSISLRGTGANHTFISWHGVRLNSPMNGQTDLNLIPSSFFNSIAINAGGNDGGLGGSLELLDQDVLVEKHELMIRSGAGSFGTYVATGVAKLALKNISFRSAVNYQTSQNDYPFQDPNQSGDSETRMAEAGFRHLNSMQQATVRFPNSVVDGAYWFVRGFRSIPPTAVSLTDVFTEDQEDRSHRIRLSWKFWKKDIRLQLNTAYLNDYNAYEHSGLSEVSRHRTYLFRNKASFRYTGWKPKLTASLVLDQERARSTNLEFEQRRVIVGYDAGIADWELGNLHIRARVKQEMNGNLWSPVAPMTRVTWKKQGVVDLRISASGARNYQFPTFNDLFWSPGGNPDLAPETSWNADVGLAIERVEPLVNGSILEAVVSINNYYNFVDNWIIWTPVSGLLWTPSNVKKVSVRGIESQLELTYGRQQHGQIKLVGSYAFTKATNEAAFSPTDQSVGKQLIYQPMHQWNVQVTGVMKFVRFSSILDYTGRRFTTTDNTQSLPWHLLVHLSVGQDFKLASHRLSWDLTLRNVFDVSYHNIAMRPFPGRNVMATISYHFIKSAKHD